MIEVDPIITVNLIIRVVNNATDICDLVEVYQDKRVMDIYGYTIPNIEQISQGIRNREDEMRNLKCLYLVIESKINKKVLGFILLQYHEYNWMIEFAINYDFQGLGFGKEAVKATVDMCKENNLHHLKAHVKNENHKTLRLLESLGFRINGESLFHQGTDRETMGVTMYKEFIQQPQ